VHPAGECDPYASATCGSHERKESFSRKDRKDRLLRTLSKSAAQLRISTRCLCDPAFIGRFISGRGQERHRLFQGNSNSCDQKKALKLPNPLSPQSRQERREEIVFDLVACLREVPPCGTKAGERPLNQKDSSFQVYLWPQAWSFWRIGLSPILQKYHSLSALCVSAVNLEMVF
jgi:hypothetical protein